MGYKNILRLVIQTKALVCIGKNFYSRSEDTAVVPLGFRIRHKNGPSSLTLLESVFSMLVLEIVCKKWESISVSRSLSFYRRR